MNLLVKSPLRFSGIAVSIVIIMFFVLIFLDKNPVVYSSNIIFIAPLQAVFLFFSIKIFKDVKKELRFWQALAIGGLFTLFFAALYAIWLGLDASLFGAEHFDEYRTLMIDKITANKEMLIEEMGEEGYQGYLEAGASSNLRIIQSLSVNNLLIGLLVTPLLSILMRTSQIKRK